MSFVHQPAPSAPTSKAHLYMPANSLTPPASPFEIRFNPASLDPADAKLSFVRTPYVFASGTIQRRSNAFIKGNKIQLLDNSDQVIGEGSSTAGQNVRLAAGAIYEFQYDLAFQNFGDSEYIDIGIMDRDKFDAHVTNDDPAPHSDALENYQSDGTGQTDNNNTLRSTTGAGRIDLSESTTDKVICLGAYNANATDVKEVAWWHTYWWIWEVAL